VRPVLLVALGGALGSVARWGLSGLIQRASGSTWPWGTFAVNVAGSLLIGFIGALAIERVLLSPNSRLLLITGVLGGFTTFSAYSYETVGLLREGRWPAAAAYALGSIVVGVTATIAGYSVGMRVG
jgi:CrcB protein